MSQLIRARPLVVFTFRGRVLKSAGVEHLIISDLFDVAREKWAVLYVSQNAETDA